MQEGVISEPNPMSSPPLTSRWKTDELGSTYFRSMAVYILIICNPFAMKKKTQKAVVIETYGGKATVKEVPMPELKDGEVLIKVEASTINPSDKLLMDGACFERPLPSICGIEGTGRVIDAKG